jgi:hypothetical protein
MVKTLCAALLLLAGCGGNSVDADAGCNADASMPVGAGLNRCDNTCRRAGGFICAYGTGMDRCPAGDGVNDCDCYAGGVYACTLVGDVPIDGGSGPDDRPDGAPPWALCRNHADCPNNGKCVFDPDPRETLGRCSYR